MFDGAESFNQPLNNWNVSNVRYMNFMFRGARSFNQPLNNWDVRTRMCDYVPIRLRLCDMFSGATSFVND